jgi:hypothetical protein
MVILSIVWEPQPMLVPSPDERIRELCTELLSAGESEWEPLVAELKAALKEHTRWMRAIAGETLKRASKDDVAA